MTTSTRSDSSPSGGTPAPSSPGYADDDQLVDRLVEVARLNRSRRLLFLLDEVNYWTGGEARAVVGIPDRGDALNYLRREYAGRRVRYWNRNASDWVSLD